VTGAGKVAAQGAERPDQRRRRGAGPGRILAVDLARAAALGGMILFHLVYDLVLFGLLPPGTVSMPGFWGYWARMVAGSFLFLAGVSLMLAHGGGIRWPAFGRRLAVIVAAAALVSLGTWAAMPNQFIFFGILHAIATFSLLGLVFLRLPASLTLAVAAAVFVTPWLMAGPLFEARWLVWTGLAGPPPVSMDFEPLFPWFAPFLAGMALTRLARDRGLADRAAGWPAAPGPVLRGLALVGRHSLAVYLLHQPVLLSLVWLIARAQPARRWRT